ncbi:MAG: hypothetical protein MK363_16525 [Pseudomonas sp.]|nr:hypothetical protein [Pseudomonas sp.]
MAYVVLEHRHGKHLAMLLQLGTGTSGFPAQFLLERRPPMRSGEMPTTALSSAT